MIEKRSCRLLPALHARQLRKAADIDDEGQRLATIDRITDELVALGHCRPRNSMTQAERWAKDSRQARVG